MRIQKKLTALGLALVLALSFAGLASAAEKKFKVYKNIVDFAAVKDVVDGKTKGVIIDARPLRPKYNKGHIPGALSQSLEQVQKGQGQCDAGGQGHAGHLLLRRAQMPPEP